jgi:hypothetical protein
MDGDESCVKSTLWNVVGPPLVCKRDEQYSLIGQKQWIVGNMEVPCVLYSRSMGGETNSVINSNV